MIYNAAHMCDIWWNANRYSHDEYILAPGQVAPFTDLSRTLEGQAGFSIYSAVYGLDGKTGDLLTDTRWYTSVPGESVTLDEAVSDCAGALLGYGGGMRRFPMGDSPAGLFFSQPVFGWESLYCENTLKVEPFVRAHISARRSTGTGSVGPIDNSSLVPVIWAETNDKINEIANRNLIIPVQKWDVADMSWKTMVPLPIPVLISPFDTVMHRMGYDDEGIRRLVSNWRTMVMQFMRRLGVMRLYVGHSEDSIIGVDIARRFNSREYAEAACHASAGINMAGAPLSLRKWFASPFDSRSITGPMSDEAVCKVVEALRDRTFSWGVSRCTL